MDEEGLTTDDATELGTGEFGGALETEALEVTTDEMGAALLGTTLDTGALDETIDDVEIEAGVLEGEIDGTEWLETGADGGCDTELHGRQRLAVATDTRAVKKDSVTCMMEMAARGTNDVKLERATW